MKGRTRNRGVRVRWALWILIASLGAIVSTPVVCAQPVITQNPESETVLAGDRVSISVAALGTAPLQYRWRRNGRLLPIRRPTLDFVATRRRAGTYLVVVRDGTGEHS